MVTVSVPGKIHVMGEHAVVYGKPALIAAVNLRLFVTITHSPGKTRDKHPSTSNTLLIEASESMDYVRHAVEKVREHLKLESLPKLKVTVSSQIPAGYHVGSSAAVAVATVGALIYFLKKVWNPVAINQLAYEVEKKMHGNPSGGDNTAVTFGGFLWYRKELEFLRSFWQLPIKLPPELDHFFLVDTGRPKETTGEMVAYVKAKVKYQKSKMEKLFNENEEQVRRVTAALKQGNEEKLKSAIRKGLRTLEGMGVVSRRVIPLIRSIEKAGGAAKILGGGGKSGPVGFLLCYHRQRKIVEAVCRPHGYTLQEIQLGEEGIRLEQKRKKLLVGLRHLYG